MKKTFLFMMMLMLFVSCATRTVGTAYISSQTDPNYSPVKTDPIYILLGDEASMSDRQFYPFLKTEMVTNGFNIVDDASAAKYLLLLKTASERPKIEKVMIVPQQTPANPYSHTHTGDKNMVQRSPFNDAFLASMQSYHQKKQLEEAQEKIEKIYLMLYATEDIRNEKFMTVWEGYIGAGEKGYKSHSRAVLKSLFDVFGTNYEAHAPIKIERGE